MNYVYICSIKLILFFFIQVEIGKYLLYKYQFRICIDRKNILNFHKTTTNK